MLKKGIDMFSDDDIEKINKALSSRESSIYQAIGHFVKLQETTSLGISGEDDDIKNKEAVGRDWFDNNLDRIRERVCNNEKIKNFIKKNGINDQQTLGLLVVDAISGAVVGVPPFFIAALIVKIGLNELCLLGEDEL